MPSPNEGSLSFEANAKNLVVEERERGERLVLGAGANAAVGREVLQERRDLLGPQLVRMAFAVMDDEALDPVAVGALRPRGIVTSAQGATHEVEELGRTSWRRHGTQRCERRAVRYNG